MRSEHRILTTHVGSLVRPPELLAILETLYAGKPVSGAELDAALERAVTDVVKHQADCGVDIVSDGEYGKSHSWSQYIIERLQGFERRPQPSGAGLAAHREKNTRTLADQRGLTPMTQGMLPANHPARRHIAGRGRVR
jgi:methionine synthase II (cobalamin-independent)